VTIGPVRLPTPEDARESAARAPVLDGFGRLATYFAPPGRPLTPRGNLKIADARALAELLGTSDVYEERVGDRVWRKRSSTDFIEVDHWQWWAHQCGALRHRQQRMVAVQAWRKRRQDDPVAEVDKAFRVLLDFGVLGSYTGRVWACDEVLDAGVLPLLARPLHTDNVALFEDLVGACRLMLHQHAVEEYYPQHAAHMVDRQLMLLERCGLLTQSDVEHVPGLFAQTQRIGGLVQLTPIGVWLLVGLLDEIGVEVATL